MLRDPDLVIVARRVPRGWWASPPRSHLASSPPRSRTRCTGRCPGGARRHGSPTLQVFWFSGAAFAEDSEHPCSTACWCRAVDRRRHSPTASSTVMGWILTSLWRRWSAAGSGPPLRSDALLRYARVARGERVMRPYPEALWWERGIGVASRPPCFSACPTRRGRRGGAPATSSRASPWRGTPPLPGLPGERDSLQAAECGSGEAVVPGRSR